MVLIMSENLSDKMYESSQEIIDTKDVMEKCRKGVLGATPDPKFIQSLLIIKENQKGANTIE